MMIRLFRSCLSRVVTALVAAVALVVLMAGCSSSTSAGSPESAGDASPQPNVAEPSSDLEEPSVPGQPSVEPTAAASPPSSSVGAPTTSEVPARAPSANETKAVGVTLWLPHEDVSYEDFLAVDAVERRIEIPSEVSDREHLGFVVQAWLDGPTSAELDRGFLDPFPVFNRGDGCDRDFDLEWVPGEELVVVTLCGSAPSAGVGADARAIASFEHTVEDAYGVRAALLSQGGHWCYGNMNDHDPLRCLAEPTNCAGEDLWFGVTASVVNIAVDDPDGGLVTHSSPGIEAPVIGLLPRGAIDIAVTGRCQVVDDGGIWWEVVDGGSRVWANANWLEATNPVAPSIVDDGCFRADTHDAPLVTQDSEAEPAAHDHLVDVIVDERPICRTVTIVLGHNFDVAEQTGEPSVAVAGGIEIERKANHLAIRLPSGPDRFDFGNFFNADQHFFGEGDSAGAALVSLADEGEGAEIIVITGSDSPPQITFGSNPARIEVTTLTNPPWRPVQVDGGVRPSFVVPQIGQTGPGQVTAIGWGVAFEASGLANVVDGTGTLVETAKLVDLRASYSTTGSLSFRTGNPGVSWAPFAIEVSNLAAGDYRLVLDPCDQCDPVDPATGIPFTVVS